LAPSTSDGVDLVVNNTEFEKGLRVDGEAEGRWRKSKMTPASFLTALPLCCLLPHSRREFPVLTSEQTSMFSTYRWPPVLLLFRSGSTVRVKLLRT